MAFELIFSDLSEAEAKNAMDYYDQINPSLGERFLIELLDTYHKLSVAPKYYSFISSIKSSKIRDVKIPSFPYVVLYEIIENTVYVISVMNSYQNPLFS